MGRSRAGASAHRVSGSGSYRNLRNCLAHHAAEAERWSSWTRDAAAAMPDAAHLTEGDWACVLDRIEDAVSPLYRRRFSDLGVPRPIDPASCIRMKLPSDSS